MNDALSLIVTAVTQIVRKDFALKASGDGLYARTLELLKEWELEDGLTIDRDRFPAKLFHADILGGLGHNQVEIWKGGDELIRLVDGRPPGSREIAYEHVNKPVVNGAVCPYCRLDETNSDELIHVERLGFVHERCKPHLYTWKGVAKKYEESLAA